MSFVVTLQDYVPTPKYNGTAWTQARIEESFDGNAPWIPLATVNLVPADTDPTNPQARSFTVDNAQYESGWYRVIFLDVNGNQLPTEPIHNVPDDGPEYAATLHQVGALLRSRTVDGGGNERGTFTRDTRPTDTEVSELIKQATGDLSLAAGDDIPDKLVDDARRLVALRAAMLVELSYFPEQVAVGRSPYQQYKDLWDSMVGTPGRPGAFIVAVEGALGDDSVDVELGAGLPYFGFGDGSEGPMVGLRTIM